MTFSKNRRLADLITANAEQFITSAHVTDAAIVPGDLHATLDLTGKTITVANASTGDSDTTVANTAFVQQEIAALVDSSPSALNTLNELAAALGDDANFSTTVTNSIATKLPLAGGTMTGDITASQSVFNITNNDFRLKTSGAETMLRAVANGAVEIMHDNSTKLTTTSTGISVTGILTSTGLNSTSGTVEFADGSSAFDSSNSNGYPVFTHTNGSAQIGFARAGGSTGIGYIGADSTYNLAVFDSSFNKTMVLTQTGNLGIGTTAPTLSLDVRGTQGSPASSGTTQVGSLSIRGTGSHFMSSGMLNASPYTGWFQAQDANNLATSFPLALNPNGGNVGIGTTSPTHDVHIKKAASETALAIQSNVGGSGSAFGGRLRLQLGAQSNSGSGNADTQAGDTLGQIMFEGQGTDYSYQGGNIKTIVTVGDGDDNRSNQATAMTFETIEVGAVSPEERMRITPTGLHTTGGLHEVHSSNPNNFVAGCAADTWHDITNYNYQNQHNGPGVDNTAQTITQVVWQNNSSVLGYIVRMYIIHGAYSANTHTIYSSAGTDSVLDGGSSFGHIYSSKYDTGGNGGLVYATVHTTTTTLKIGVRFNNHTGTAYNPLTMQIKTNGPPAAGTTPIMRVWRL